jgi:polar amino acid transport system substrate-binding protein
MRARGWIAGLWALAALAVAGPATAQTTDEIVRRGKVVIAIDTTVPPYGMLDANNQPAGIDVDVANLIGKNLKVPVEFVTVNSPGRIPALLCEPGRHGGCDLLDHGGARAPGIVLDPLCRPVRGADRAEDRQHQGTGRPEEPQVGVTRGALEDGALTAVNVPASPSCASTTARRSPRPCCPARSTPWAAGGPTGNLPAQRREGRGRVQSSAAEPPTSASASAAGNPDLLQWLKLVRVPDQELGRTGRHLAQAPQQHADDLPAGVLRGERSALVPRVRSRRAAGFPAGSRIALHGAPRRSSCPGKGARTG